MLRVEENNLITRTGPGTPMGELFRRFWQPILLTEELPAPDCPPLRVRVLGEELVAFRDSDGKIGLLDRYCAHRRADLFFGRNEECGLRCVYHGWKYDVEGRCVDMPSEPPESQFKEKIKLTAYPCVEYGGFIWTYMGPPERRATAALPAFEWAHVPDSHRYIGKVILNCNYLQALEGSIDTVHSAFLHRWFNRDRSLGNQPQASEATRYRAQFRSERGAWTRFQVKDTDYGLMIGAYREVEEDESYVWHISHWLLPAYAMAAGGGAGQTVLCVIRVPIDDERFTFYWIRWNPDHPLTPQELAQFRSGSAFQELLPGTYLPKRNKENDWLIDRELQHTWNSTGIRSVPEQDEAVTISMGPIVDRSKEHLGTSDMAIIAMRRKLLKLVRELQEGTEPYAACHGDVYRVRPADVLLPRDMPFDEGARELITARV